MGEQRQQSQTVPAKYGGKWIAWNDANDHIVASGESYEEARRKALDAGVKLPPVEFVPPSDRAFVGGL